MKIAIPCVVLLIFTSLILSEKDQYLKKDQELEELFLLMQGSFNSEAQAKSDSTYYNISLHMYPIWPNKGYFLYVEQALNNAQDKPYRQRVYELKRLNDTTFSSAVFTLSNEANWIGKWNSPEDFNSMSKSDLNPREGCEVILQKIGPNHFKGRTAPNTCESSLRGASYATSEVEITENSILSWDRGLDAEGRQVWGAKKGGYIFRRLN